MFSWPEKYCRKLTKAGQFTAATETNPHLWSVCYYYPGITTNVIQQIKPLPAWLPLQSASQVALPWGFLKGLLIVLRVFTPQSEYSWHLGNWRKWTVVSMYIWSPYMFAFVSHCARGCCEAEPGFFVWLQLWPSSSLPAPSSPGLQDASLTGA